MEKTEDISRHDDEPLLIGPYRRAHRRLWYAVLIMNGFLALGVLALAITLRDEGIQRSDAVKTLAEQNSDLIDANSKLAAEGVQAHDALCQIKSNLSAKIDRTKKVLEEHKEDPVFGIPRVLIVTGLDSDKDQLKALNEDVTDCPAQ